jgi:TM2 domain-containing membrane protein YozV/type II secretory pathway pseudopilin PulG
MVKGEDYCKDCVSLKFSAEKKEERSPVLAAILSFVIAGLGQIYNGQIGKGLLILFTSWLIFPWIIGIFDAYKTAGRINKGEIIIKSRPGCVIATVIGIVVVMVGIFFMALLAAIAIPNFLRARITANENMAQATLKTISTAIEVYRAANNGKYPLSESDLTSVQPPYLNRPYSNNTVNGYIFSEIFDSNGYKIVAKPRACEVTGSKFFVIESGGVLSSQACGK